MPTKVTAMRVEFDLSEADISFFKKRLVAARESREPGDEEKIVAKVEKVAAEALAGEPNSYVRERVEKLTPLVAMLRDEDWRLEGDDRARVLDALVYFADPHDIIADHTPGLGYLDDAIMIDLVALELAPEIEAYADFVAAREDRAEGGEVADVSLSDVRDVLQARMRRRRRRSGRGGVSDAAEPISGFAFI